jgi:hypothetical protein
LASHRGGSDFDPCGNLRFVAEKVALEQPSNETSENIDLLYTVRPIMIDSNEMKRNEGWNI